MMASKMAMMELDRMARVIASIISRYQGVDHFFAPWS
jgi:hypothetical protein